MRLKTVRAAHLAPDPGHASSSACCVIVPAQQIARDLHLKHPGTVYVNAHRVLKQVRAVCEEFDEDLSDGFESDVSRRG